jgi:hypothetical protein
VVMAGVGHVSNIEAVERFTTELRGFLRAGHRSWSDTGRASQAAPDPPTSKTGRSSARRQRPNSTGRR